MELLWDKSSLFDQPPDLDCQEAYEIGFADGQKDYWKRETFMLHRWGAEQKLNYDKGYKDGKNTQQTSRSRSGPCIATRRFGVRF